MHTFVSINERIVAASRAKLPASPSAILNGRGVFTTVAIYQGTPFLWSEHWSKLIEDAGRIGMTPAAIDESRIRRVLRQLMKVNKVESGLAEVVLLGNEHPQPSPGRATVMISTRERPAPRGEVLTVTVSPYRINTMSPLTGVKSIHYLEQILSLEEARERDFDEAVMVNERGEIVSATTANLFWVTEGSIHTPAIGTGAIAGVTRGCIIALAGELSFPMVEGAYEISSLSDADEIFLTSAAIGLGIVTTYDFRHYTVPIGSVAFRLLEGFRQLTLRGK